MDHKQQNGPEVAILTGRPKCLIATQLPLFSVINPVDGKQDPAWTYRLEGLPAHIRARTTEDPESGC